MMKDGITVRQREIILIPFPFSDLTSHKRRPAFVLSNNKFNKNNEDIVCCLITSNPKVHKHCISITQKDLETGNLFFDSKIKPYRLFTVSKKIIYKHLGLLSMKKSLLVEKEINELIKINA